MSADETDVCDSLNRTNGLDLLRKPLEIWYTTLGIPIVLLIGVPGNLAFLFTLYRVPSMRTTTNLHLANLAVSDFAYITIFSTLILWGYLISPVSNSTFARSWLECCIVILLIDIPYFASNTIVTLVAFERYYAICRPLQQNASEPRRHTVLLVVSWSLSFAFGLSICIRYSNIIVLCVFWPDTDEYRHRSNSVQFCSAGQPWVVLYAQGLYSGIWLVGSTANSVLYYRIIRNLGQRPAHQAGASASTTQARSVRRSVARMLMINSVVFFLCQAPYAIIFNALSLIDAASGKRHFSAEEVTSFWPVAIFLNLLNSALNPIIYGVANSRYRQAFLQAFGCNQIGKPNSQIVISTTPSNIRGHDNPITLDDQAAIDGNAENKL